MLNLIKDIEKEIDIRQTRIFSLLISIILYVQAIVRFSESTTVYLIVFFIAGFFFISGIFAPVFARPIHLTLALVFKFALNILTFIALFLIYFLIITPIGIFLKATGKDLLDLKINGRESFWQVHEEVRDKERYLKQF